jgi:hypothetical protein
MTTSPSNLEIIEMVVGPFVERVDDGRTREKVDGKVRKVAYEEEHVERDEGQSQRSLELISCSSSARIVELMAGLIGNGCIGREQERKYFDSGDYAMQKAGVASPDSVGSPGGLGQGLKGMEGLERATPER